MNYKIITLCLAATTISACSSTCTEEDLQAKAMELAEKVQKIAASGDMNKLMAFSQKSMKISKAAEAGDDIQAACEAADELLSELD
ncbi:hypothetical protein [Marinicella rhabdoformis]|uniref:hypothetical protein n=1 Tax=Marinicella rhabdoformis TaxID=2580566 RepID=UPI0012AEC08F|nr:hypothetical protein [Marinicella rhabdoformis]